MAAYTIKHEPCCMISVKEHAFDLEFSMPTVPSKTSFIKNLRKQNQRAVQHFNALHGVT